MFKHCLYLILAVFISLPAFAVPTTSLPSANQPFGGTGGGGGGGTALDQTTGTDFRYDSSQACYYTDTNGNSAHDVGEHCITSKETWTSDFTSGSNTFGIQEAITSVCTAVASDAAAIRGGIVHIPSGIFDLTTHYITVPASCFGLIIKGEGTGQRFGGTNSNTGTLLKFDLSSAGVAFTFTGPNSHWRVEDINIQFNNQGAGSVVFSIPANNDFWEIRHIYTIAGGSVTSTGTIIDITDSQSYKVDENRLEGMGTAIAVSGAEGNGSGQITNNEIRPGVGTGAGTGLLISGTYPCVTLEVDKNTFESGNRGIDATSTGTHCSIFVNGNYFEPTEGAGLEDVRAGGKTAFSFTNNFFNPSGISAFHRVTQTSTTDAVDSFSNNEHRGDITMDAGSCTVSGIVKGTGSISACATVLTGLSINTSAKLAAILTDEAGTGPVIFANSNGLIARTSATATSSRTLTNNLGLTMSNGDGVAGNPTIGLDYSQLLSGNPAFNAKECMFTTEGASGGGFLCEGNTANINEQLHLFPSQDGADTTDFIAIGNSSGAATAVAPDSVALTTGTTGNYVQSVATTAPLSGGAAGSEGTVINLTTSMNTGKLIGRTTATAGVMEEISPGSSLTLSSLTLDRAALTGDVTASAGSNATTVANVPASATVSIDGSEVTSGLVANARGGTGIDSSASTGVARVSSGTWSFNAGISHLATSTSADLAGVLSDEAGTGPVLFANANGMIARTSATATASRTLTNNLGLTMSNGDGVAGNPTIGLDYSQLLSGNPAFNAKECMFTTEGASGGGFLCEGGTANTNEQLHLFPSQDGADTTDFIAIGNSAGAATAVAPDSVALTTGTTGNYIQSISTTGPLSGGAAGSEGTVISLTTSMNTGKLIGRTTASSGVMEEIAPDSTLTLSSLTLGRAALTGDVTASAGSNATVVANVPAAATVSIDGSEVTSGVVAVSRGGTGAAPGADDQVLVADSTSAATWRTLPSCSNGTTDKLLYNTSTNTWSCGTDAGAGGGISYADAAAAVLAGFY